MFFEMQVNCDISHPVCGGSGLSGLPGSNAWLQAVRRRRRRSTQMRRAKGGKSFSARLSGEAL